MHFLNLHEILNIMKKTISFIAQIFWKLLTPKNGLPSIPKRSSFTTPFGSQSVRGSQTLLKSPRNRFYPNFPLIQDKLSLKHLSQSDPKSKDSLLTRWLLITCILLIVERNPGNLSNRNYLQNQKQFLKVLLHF